MDTTKSAADKAVHAVSYTAALSIGLAVVATKMGMTFCFQKIISLLLLFLGITVTHSAVNAFLASLLYTKQAGTNALESASQSLSRENVENIIHSALEQSQKIAKVPQEKAEQHANSFLDNANTIFDKILELPAASEPADAALKDRIAFLSTRVTDGLVNQANNNVLDPLRTKVHDLAQQMQNNLNMVGKFD